MRGRSPKTLSRASSHTKRSSDSLRVLHTSTYDPGSGASEEWANAIAIDDSGNTYVAGLGTTLPNGMSYVTVKIDSLGQQRWVARYTTGAPMTSHIATAIAVDSLGCVYVTGTSDGWDDHTDIATIKYDPNGTELWVARYGSDASDESPTAILLDDRGSFYICGTTSAGGTDDVVVLRYRSTGEVEWASIQDSPEHEFETAYSAAHLPNGSVVVAAEQRSASYEYCMRLFCIDTSGILRWSTSYVNEPGTDEYFPSLAVDPLGRVYVTMMTTDHTGGSALTLGFSSIGVLRWSATYTPPSNGSFYPADIECSPDGAVIVTGQHEWDAGTLAYDSLGRQQWIDIYNGTGSDYDSGHDVLVAPDGEIFVVGQSRGTGATWGTQDDYVVIRYSPFGQRRWVTRYNGPADGYDDAWFGVLDRSGNVTITGRSERANEDYDIAVVRYASDGTQRWVSRLDGPGSSYIVPLALRTDGSGNVFVAAFSREREDWYDGRIVSFDRGGQFRWSARISVSPGGYDHLEALAVDRSGHVVVCGESDIAEQNYRDIVTAKFDGAGQRLWLRTYDSPDHTWDYPIGMDVDVEGNVIVVGATASYAHIVIKYGPDGDLLWTAEYNFSGSSRFGPVIDDAGNVTSAYQSYDGTPPGVTILQHSAGGALLWSYAWSIPSTTITIQSILSDLYGYSYVLAKLRGGNSPDRLALVKLDPFGRHQWTAIEGTSTDDHWLWSHRLLIDEAGHIVIIGTMSPWAVGGTPQLVTIGYSANGERRWGSSIPTGGDIEILQARSVLGGGHEVISITGGSAVLVSRFDAHGSVLMTHWLDTDDYSGYIGHAEVNAFGELILAGHRGGPSWATTMLLAVGGIDFQSNANLLTAAPIVVEQNFPNPFNPSTIIHFTLGAGGPTQVTVHNAIGQTIARLADADLPAGSYNYTWNAEGLASGIYLVVVKSGGHVATTKAILVK